MTSYTKPEVHNALHCRQKRTEPQPQVTCTEDLVKFGHVVFEMCEQTDIQTCSSLYVVSQKMSLLCLATTFTFDVSQLTWTNFDNFGTNVTENVSNRRVKENVSYSKDGIQSESTKRTAQIIAAKHCENIAEVAINLLGINIAVWILQYVIQFWFKKKQSSHLTRQ